MKVFWLTLISLLLISCNEDYSNIKVHTHKTEQTSTLGDSSDDGRDEQDSKPEPVDPDSIDPDTLDPDASEPPAQSLPSCDRYCENDSNTRSTNDGYSYLAFANFGYRGVGRCRGHALVTQKMSLLARFENGAGCNVKNPSCISQLKSGIDKVLSFKTYKFSGFNNLYELSNIPSLKIYLKNHIRGISHRYSAGNGYIQNQMYGSRALNVFYELKRRVGLDQIPYVGVVGKQTGSHALLIYGTGFINDKEVLCARDPNIVLGYSESCESYVYVEKRKVFYKRHDRSADFMSFFQLTSDEDRRVKIYKTSLFKACLETNRRNKLCK